MKQRASLLSTLLTLRPLSSSIIKVLAPPLTCHRFLLLAPAKPKSASPQLHPSPPSCSRQSPTLPSTPRYHLP
ncbi:hypothetical protein AOQ84DRAFT_57064 [Glonium stellatum]|uniref:Uncharacterized protein n=1 Tax=Glonium stellatum TaxID=574774 RepID=A0A8E2EZJ5_9PEZI|nr:hypothetical protein AOQ84DRAFT_57064 [Glonium stellatum]